MPSAAFPFEMTICGLSELEGHSDSQVSHVVSILDPAHPQPSAFAFYDEHERLELRFHDVIDKKPLHSEPEHHHIEQILSFGRNVLSEPEKRRHLLVHCHAGISRSTAAMTLILALGQPELPASAVLAQLLTIRAKAWPNLRMLSLGEEQLGRPGEFTSAVAGLYRRQLQLRPEMKDFLLGDGRAREVELAFGEPAA
jgi:predicted protein tyrosine phosphatase